MQTPNNPWQIQLDTVLVLSNLYVVHSVTSYDLVLKKPQRNYISPTIGNRIRAYVNNISTIEVLAEGKNTRFGQAHTYNAMLKIYDKSGIWPQKCGHIEL